MRGNKIVATSEPRGHQEEGQLTEANRFPGTILQIDASITPLNGQFGWKASNPGTDGLAVLKAVLQEDFEQGVASTGTAYPQNAWVPIYMIQHGEYINLLLGEVAGTGNTYAVGDKLIVDAEDGILVPFTGSPAATFGQCCEVVTQVAGSHLTLVLVW